MANEETERGRGMWSDGILGLLFGLENVDSVTPEQIRTRRINRFGIHAHKSCFVGVFENSLYTPLSVLTNCNQINTTISSNVECLNRHIVDIVDNSKIILNIPSVSRRRKTNVTDAVLSDLHPQIVADIQAVLDECNVLVKSFRMAKEEIQSNPRVEVKMKLIGKRSTDARTYNLPTVSEVAALIVGDLDAHLGERDILVETKSGLLKRISELNPTYLPLQYPLLFPYGEDGYREDIGFNIVRVVENGSRHRISPREYLAFRIHERSSEGLSDALTRGDIEPGRHGKRVILPSGFTGGARYMIQNYQDALAICGWIVYPNLFITFTCNPKWPEIERYLGERHLSAVDRPDIICRLFKMKLDALIKEIRSGLVFGNVTAVIYTVEFQKRGLPHAHILIFLSQEDGRALCQNIDTIISAEIPDKEVDSEYYRVVEEFMIHGPCGHLRKNSPCMVNGRCSKHFPKKFVDSSNFDQDGYPIYRRRDDGRFVKKNGIELDNRFVVPHNKYLLLKYRAHINIEWCNQSRSIKYLFKYVNKGHDRVTAHFYKSSDDLEKGQIVDEISMFYDCRYISACEGTWRLFGFDIQFRVPAVERLSFHLPNQQLVVYGDDDCVDNILSRPSVGESMFLAWFEANKKFPEAKELTYGQMPNKFVWKKDVREWHLRRKGFAIGRMFFVPPGSGEIYYLRCLLNLVRGATCYKDLRIVEGVQYSSFRDACYARGLLADDKEYVDAINEASKWASATSMRRLFITMLTSNVLIRPEVVWEVVWIFLAEDAEFNQRKLLDKPGLILTDEEKADYALVEIEKLLRFGKSISCFPSMPLPNMSSSSSHGNQLLDEELSYDCDALKVEHDNLVEKLTDEHRHVYDIVLSDVANAGGGLFFVYGYGGTGKTFVWKTLSAVLRSEGHIVLTVASSGIASLLLPGGRTAHS
ncbi:PREDICTED: uncharacterized protein LOC109155840 [Ipomoea nil]|uniref:uncharacterized protein LOC109155840 n=1 Tax=Ipomoea nil TaxID=35883 RepID=UPI000901B682|nr:PREDICTED: uncharacterized protein LOC109155840 [Ipomoea nil]